MHACELHIAYETALALEERLTPEITGAHEIYLDHAVDERGQPFVAVSVSGQDGVEKLTRLFGNSVRFTDRGAAFDVRILIKPHQPMRTLN